MRTRKRHYATYSRDDRGLYIKIRTPDRRVIATVLALALFDDGSGAEQAKADARLILEALNRGM